MWNRLTFAALGILLLLTLNAASPASQEQGRSCQPGDFGCGHGEYHRNGAIDELRKKAESDCCGGLGECRVGYVDLTRKEVYLDGQWCPISEGTKIRLDVKLPKEDTDEGLSLICAGKSEVKGGQKDMPSHMVHSHLGRRII